MQADVYYTIGIVAKTTVVYDSEDELLSPQLDAQLLAAFDEGDCVIVKAFGGTSGLVDIKTIVKSEK